MIEKWEMALDPNDRFPRRYRINVVGAEEDLRPLLDLFPDKAGKPWTPRLGGFKLSFYFYDLTDADKSVVERFLATGELPAASPAFVETPVEDLEPAVPALEPTAAAAPARGKTSEGMVMAPSPEPGNSRGRTVLRVGYAVPEEMDSIDEQVHQMLAQTLESRKMPFHFHKVFAFHYRQADRSTVDKVIGACMDYRLDALICVGDERPLQDLLDECHDKRIAVHYLSRLDAKKRYWRLGLITRIILKEE